MLRRSGRVRKILVAVLVALVVIGAVGLAILPEIVRRVAVSQAAKITGRVLSLEDVDLNLFTGHLALKGFKLAQRNSKESALEFERLDVRLGYLPLLRGNARVTELALVAPTIRVTRTGPEEFDFSDLLARRGSEEPSRAPSQRTSPSKWTVTLGRLSVRRLTLVARDLTTSPASEWRIGELTVDASDLTTRVAARSGRVETKLKLNGAPVTVTTDSVTLEPLAVSARVVVDGFDLAPVYPYLPPSVPAAPRAGRVSLALALAIELGQDGLKRGTVRGDVAMAGLEVFQAGRGEPFLKIPQAGVKIKDADLVARSVTIGAVELEGLALRAVRDAQQKIDLLALSGPREATAPAPAASPAGPAPPDFKVKVEQIALRKAGLTLRDEAVKPLTTLAFTDLSADVKDVSWPVAGPAAFVVSTKVPKAGRLEMKGTITPVPLDLEIAISLRDARIEPYQAYFPIPARFTASLNDESRSRVTITNGAITATSRGRNWIDKLAILAPGETTPTARLERIQVDGYDFAWPKHARASKITLTKPDIRVERDKDGVISLRKLFAPEPGGAGREPEKPEAPASAKRESAAPAEPQKPGWLPIALDFGTITIEDGNARFIDRTTTPAYSETLSRLAVGIEGLSSIPGRRARLTAQAVIGGSSAFDLKGEIAPFGEVYADITGELRDFHLTSVNPYADPLIAWFMKTGELAVKVHYRVEKNQLTADNEIVVKNLTVAPSREGDEVKKKIGLPLGMIVALITDSDNGIRVQVPLSGELNQVRASVGDAVWTAVKNALVNIVGAPFRSIGRLFKGKGDTVDELKVDPVTFAAGSADVVPEMERHLTQVADFLRRAPMIKFALAPITAPRDVENLKAQELTLRIQRLQRDRGLADFGAAVAVEFKERLPGITPPKSGEEQLALLREREPAPESRLSELQARRLEVVREALTKAEGIPADRLLASEAKASGDATEGRIEFQLEH